MTVTEVLATPPQLTALYAGYGILPPRAGGKLAGRDPVLAVIRALADGRPTQSGALMLSGEPGIGKSALLDVAAQVAATVGVRVLRAAGAQFEDVSYFGLNQLLLPLRGDLARLDRTQRNALETALGFSDGPPADRLVVSNAALSLLGHVAAEGPLLLIVDDLHWVDEASALVLGFIARRLPGGRVGLIAAERTGASRLPALDIPRHQMRPIDANQARRLGTAAYLAASVSGDLDAAEALLADAWRACPDPTPPAETALATAIVLLQGEGDLTAAQRVLLRSVQNATADDASLGPSEALRLLAYVCRLTGSAEYCESLERLIANPGSALATDMRAAARITLDAGAARRRLEEDIESLAYLTEPDEILRIGHAATFADRLPDCRPALRRVARRVAADSGDAPAMQANVMLALESYLTGRWDEALQIAEANAGLSASHGYQLFHHQAHVVLAWVAASRGDTDNAQALADDITRWAAPRGAAFMLACADYAYLLTALAQSDFEAAYQLAARISPAGQIPDRNPFAAWVTLDLVEAALRTDRRDDAVAHVRAAREAGLAALSPRMDLLSTAAAAMTAPDDEATALFERALAADEAGRWPFDQARVHLLFGERLRRMRAVTLARPQLDAALLEFGRLGAPTWADRAAATLRATGQVRQRPGSYARQELTPQELQIARLAADGMSNKQIAERLFMSHRTVGSHLYRIFPKLGVTSRAGLSSALCG